MKVYSLDDVVAFPYDHMLLIKGRPCRRGEQHLDPVTIVVEPNEVAKLIAAAEKVKP